MGHMFLFISVCKLLVGLVKLELIILILKKNSENVTEPKTGLQVP